MMLGCDHAGWGSALGCDHGCMGGKEPRLGVEAGGTLLQMGVRWAEEEGWFCAERVILESRSPVSVQAVLLAPWGGLRLSGSSQNTVLISALCQWSFKRSKSLNVWGVWASVLPFPLAKCH